MPPASLAGHSRCWLGVPRHRRVEPQRCAKPPRSRVGGVELPGRTAWCHLLHCSAVGVPAKVNRRCRSMQRVAPENSSRALRDRVLGQEFLHPRPSGPAPGDPASRNQRGHLGVDWEDCDHADSASGGLLLSRNTVETAFFPWSARQRHCAQRVAVPVGQSGTIACPARPAGAKCPWREWLFRRRLLPPESVTATDSVSVAGAATAAAVL